ncbi:MAG: asparagine synthase (glutamine-hydrolyzing), partial [Blastocatellia bacterium]|nr:asparagine synthase (glutamine-hydrolyzing) [Blastocatellia bacterium]
KSPMCGIAGILSTTGNPTLNGITTGSGPVTWEEAARRMVGSIRHRGPDDNGIEVIPARSGVCVLGQARLAILDVSPAGHNPMPDRERGNWITYNGEVYNYRSLAPLVADMGPLHSGTDTEVILRAFAKWGIPALEKLRGMFAFALWDNTGQKLLLARDRLGIKPLYYVQGNGFFAFASEVRALLASSLVERNLDHTAVWQYLGYQSVPAPRTLIENVRMLPPGSWLTVDCSGKIETGRYWDAIENANPEARHDSYETSKGKVLRILQEATEIHLLSDVPLGAFLSGGIDSSAVVALMSAVSQKPKTFSVVFDEKRFDEAQYATLIAQKYNTEHTEIPLSQEAMLADLPTALERMDQPTGDGVNTYVVSQAVRRAGVTVALSGLGGDEFFAGYPSFTRLEKIAGPLKVWGNAPGFVRSLAAKTVQTLGRSSVQAAKAAAMMESEGTLAEAYLLLRQVLSTEQRTRLLAPAFLASLNETADPYAGSLGQALEQAEKAGLPFLSQVSYAEATTYMNDVLLRDTDQMSMAHALEVRVPLLDHVLVEYVLGVPDVHKRPNGTPKRLLVESLGKLLPEEIVYRPKQGFALPFEVWMRGGLKALCERALAPERLHRHGIFNPVMVQAMWLDFLAGSREVSWSRLWVLVVLSEWIERNIFSSGRYNTRLQSGVTT